VAASSAWSAQTQRAELPPVETGRIEGTVIISKSLTAKRPRFRIYAGDGAATLPPDQPDENERDNVVVYLGGTIAGAPLSDANARYRMRQEAERFWPHILPIVRGTAVDFPNEDAVFHNVFSLSSASVFDLGRYPRGKSKSVVFERTGVVQVFCHIHADMSAVVLVLENPYFARPDSTGRYVLDGVPPGEYRITGWHERIRPITQTVRVEAGRTTTLDFNIPLPAPVASGEPRER
jgi:plastocyanin